ncbi:hypothetical protein DFP73DRAFT_285543, partial [Morchella snyderi]
QLLVRTKLNDIHHPSTFRPFSASSSIPSHLTTYLTPWLATNEKRIRNLIRIMALSPERAATPVSATHQEFDQQTPYSELPSLGEHKCLLLQLKGLVEAAVAKLTEVTHMESFVKYPGTDGGAESMNAETALMTAEAKRIAKAVETALAEVEGIWAGLVTRGRETEELVMEAERSLKERKSAKSELEELCKEKVRLEAENERLKKELSDSIKEAESGAKEQWGHPLWKKANKVCADFNSTKVAKERVSVEVERAGEHFDSTEQGTEKLILELGRAVIEKRVMEAEAQRSVAETDRLRVEMERLGLQMDRFTIENELAKAPRD